MLHCQCGYSCGIKAALDRHLATFPGVEGHSPCDPPPERRLKLRSKTAPQMLLHGISDGDDSCVGDFLTPPGMSAATTPASFRRSLPHAISDTEMACNGHVRLLLVRHAQSGNKTRSEGVAASSDPDLSDFGFQQAEALGRRLERECRGLNGKLLVACSPMRRCLQTILPMVKHLDVALDDCLVHGGCYEFGCAGTSHAGSSPSEIRAEFPQFRPVYFGASGAWDYRGSHPRETEIEARARGERIVEWMLSDAVARLQARDVGEAQRTFVLCCHQTLADLLCQLLIDDTADGWAYGDIMYKIGNAAFTEIIMRSDGSAVITKSNDGGHLVSLGPPPARSCSSSPIRSSLHRRHI